MPKGVPKTKTGNEVHFDAISSETQAELKGMKQVDGKTILMIEVSIDSNLASAWKMFQGLGKVPPIEKVVGSLIRQGLETFVAWIQKVPASPFDKLTDEAPTKKELHSLEAVKLAS